jgi:ABC-type phosphate/phosphonate transport system permease subunit
VRRARDLLLTYRWLVVFLRTQLEHLVRIWSSIGDPQYAKLGPCRGRLRYMRSFHALVDFFAVMPWYISWFIDVKVGFATALRVLRMFRLLKFDNYTKAFDVVRNVFYKEKELLFVATFYTFCALLICATIMFLLAPNTKEFKCVSFLMHHLLEQGSHVPYCLVHAQLHSERPLLDVHDVYGHVPGLAADVTKQAVPRHHSADWPHVS